MKKKVRHREHSMSRQRIKELICAGLFGHDFYLNTCKRCGAEKNNEI